MSILRAPDDWLIDRIYQPIVNAAWYWLEIKRRNVILGSYALFGMSTFVVGDWPSATIFIIFFTLWYFYGPPKMARGLIEVTFRYVLFGIALWPAINTISGGLTTCRLLPLVSAMYLMATEEPPKGRRRDVKTLVHKWAAQWTWLPVKSGAG